MNAPVVAGRSWWADALLRRRMALVVASAAVAGVAGFAVLSPAQATDWYRATGYVGIFSAVVWTVVAAVAVAPRPFVPAVRAWAAGLGWPAWLAVALGFLGGLALQTADYAVVADEPVLVAISHGLHENRDPAFTARGFDLGEGFEAANRVVDKRPLLFPLLVSLVHDLTGFRVENAFFVNTLLLGLLLVLAADTGRLLGGRAGAAILAGLIATSPLVAQMGRSAGFDVLGLVTTLLLARAGVAVLRDPADERRQAVLVLMGVLCAQVRYEGALFIGVTAALLLVAWFRHGRPVLTPALAAAPLLLVPYAWRHQVFEQGRDLFQLDFKPGAQSVFSLDYVPDNMGHALNFFLSFDHREANSPLLFLLGLPAVVLALLVVVRALRSSFVRWDPVGTAWAAVGAGLAVQTALTFVYFWGQYDDLAAQRLSLPLHLLFAVAVVVVAAQPGWELRLGRWLPLGLLIYGWVWTVPSLAKDRFSLRNQSARLYNEVRALAEAKSPGQLLVMDNLCGLAWLQAGVSVVLGESLRHLGDRYAWHFERQSFAEYWALQRQQRDFASGDWVPLPEDLIFSGYGLEPFRTWTLGPTYRVRLSRVTRLPAPRPAQEPPAGLRSPTAEERASFERNEKKFSAEWAEKLP